MWRGIVAGGALALLAGCGGRQAGPDDALAQRSIGTADGTLTWTEVGGVFEGPVTFRRKGGGLSYEGTYHTGRRDGVWTYYHPDGKTPRVQVPYANGQIDGVLHTWREDGSPELDLTYGRGHATGPGRWHSARGAPVDVDDFGPAARQRLIAARRAEGPPIEQEAEECVAADLELTLLEAEVRRCYPGGARPTSLKVTLRAGPDGVNSKHAITSADPDSPALRACLGSVLAETIEVPRLAEGCDVSISFHDP
jgi:hypothetical protein